MWGTCQLIGCIASVAVSKAFVNNRTSNCQMALKRELAADVEWFRAAAIEVTVPFMSV